ncbi:MAG: heterodisulfide reductase-related iron-sulfur binding cluster [Syntrophorhabdaceae bacterium]|nr:heterodisulfide reductase-related iron-sulfur binding cluster [Syntrophorhabdaceae bacterium]
MADKVVYFTGCFSNYYDPEIGKALVKIMERNGIEVIVPEQKCCGMPMMANSNLEGAKKNYNFNVKSLAEAASSGYKIITTCPSCNMMLKREGLPFFDSEQARFVSANIYDASEYLLELLNKGKLDTNFNEMNVKVFYHNPCHLKVQNIIDAPLKLLKLIPGLEIVKVNTSCCGMGGSYGMKKINFDRSQKIGKKVWEEIMASGADIIVTECGGCGLQIKAGTGVKVMHPLVLLNQAYKTSTLSVAA